MTLREQAIFDHLIRKRYLRILDPSNVSIIQIQNPDTILIQFIIQPSCEQFLNDAIKEHRELAIEQIIV